MVRIAATMQARAIVHAEAQGTSVQIPPRASKTLASLAPTVTCRNHAQENVAMDRQTLETRRLTPLRTPTGLGEASVHEISSALNALLADVFALYLKTKNFHWHL